MQQMDTLFHQAQTSLDAGMSTENDMLRITAKRSEITYQLQKAKNGAYLCAACIMRHDRTAPRYRNNSCRQFNFSHRTNNARRGHFIAPRIGIAS